MVVYTCHFVVDIMDQIRYSNSSSSCNDDVLVIVIVFNGYDVYDVAFIIRCNGNGYSGSQNA